ncbi:CubicO group peptidase (beta-lactamase class C family) [Rhodococcus sp. OK519]|uniref:serine hydrolase n=1 Tax=Rhodococcus sp. OK519 TaxID=2135729 RepID=UPI000D38DAD4|nr:CubicO group peptidase (beta-lactamase class C family) [Rhodococcus sp. OK519]
MRPFHRRVLAVPLAAVALVAGCSQATDTTASTPAGQTPQNPARVAGVPLPEASVADAVAQLDGLAEKLMDSSGIPGMAVAVVHGGQTLYAKGFGVRAAGSSEKVDADTVFQLASMSKPIGATVVARQVASGVVDWDTPVASKLPGFALADPYVSQHVTIGDLYAHRSGLPDHAGDELEDLGYDRRQILERLRLLPLAPFRDSYAYTNFGVTAAAEAVAAASGTDWAGLSDRLLYQPLGMSDTSSRFADYAARENKAVGHVKIDGNYVAQYVREPDAQSPAGGVSSSVNDVAAWLTMLLADGQVDGQPLVPAEALQPAISPQSVSSPPTSPDTRAGFYGYGFNVGTSPAGRVTLSHSGAFALGAATSFLAIPSADTAIVVLTNAAPVGVAETLSSGFSDLVQFGEIREEWTGLYEQAFAKADQPQGALVGQSPPTDPAPARPLPDYVGSYANDYFGAAQVSERDGRLVLTMGPKGLAFPLTHWDGDVFTFTPDGENAPAGTISSATFAGDTLTLEFFDSDGLGTFTRSAP